MKLTGLAFLLYSLHLQGCVADKIIKCPSPVGTNGMKITVITHHNKTGQYIEQVKAQDLSENGMNFRSWNVTTHTGQTTCIGKDCGLVQTTFSPIIEILPGYTNIPGLGYYKYHKVASTWPQAEEICESEGAHLVVISSKQEQEAVVRLFHENQENPVHYRNYLLFVGIHDWFSTGQFRTILGQPLQCANYVDWANGQPDNATGTEHCASIFNNGQLNDINCNVRLPFMCEMY
ncbi:hemolymph lipopolysaccharide-binding protein isoform X2 [Anabrus simplex]